jgi:hypothetical protein
MSTFLTLGLWRIVQNGTRFYARVEPLAERIDITVEVRFIEELTASRMEWVRLTGQLRRTVPGVAADAHMKERR